MYPYPSAIEGAAAKNTHNLLLVALWLQKHEKRTLAHPTARGKRAGDWHPSRSTRRKRRLVGAHPLVREGVAARDLFPTVLPETILSSNSHLPWD